MIALARNLPQLRSLSLDNCGNLTHEALRAVAQNCQLLHVLEITSCPRIKAADILRNVPHFNSLKTFKCSYNTSAVVVALTARCPNLEYLHSYYTLFDDNEISILAQNCPALRTLDLPYNRLITDVGVVALGNGCKHMREINLNRCINITDIAINEIADKCKELTALRVYDCPLITTNSLKKIVEQCLDLQVLMFKACSEELQELVTMIRSMYSCVHLI